MTLYHSAGSPDRAHRNPPPPGQRPKHLADLPVEPRELLLPPPARTTTVRRGWHWLLVIPMVLPLLTPVYNRRDPQLWGVPFFYWYQIGCVVVASLIMIFVYLVTKGRRR